MYEVWYLIATFVIRVVKNLTKLRTISAFNNTLIDNCLLHLSLLLFTTDTLVQHLLMRNNVIKLMQYARYHETIEHV